MGNRKAEIMIEGFIPYLSGIEIRASDFLERDSLIMAWAKDDLIYCSELVAQMFRDYKGDDLEQFMKDSNLEILDIRQKPDWTKLNLEEKL